MPDEFELDLSDLMAPDATEDDTTAPEDTTVEAPEEETETPAPATDDEATRLRAELEQYKQHVNNLLAKVGENKPTQPVPDNVPDLQDFIEKNFAADSRAPLTKALQILEARVEAKLKGYTPKAEWDAAQPVMQQAILTMDEQRTQQTLKQRGLSDQQIHEAKAAMDELIKGGAKFSNYEAAYLAGHGVADLKSKQAKAAATQAGRKVKAERAVTNDNTPPDTPATKASLKATSEEILNDPFGVLDRIAQGVK